jgi:hypothetical protein
MEENQTSQVSITEALPAGVHLQSKKRLFYAGLAIAILNPVISGLIIGILFIFEPEMRLEGKIITALAIIWGAIVLGILFASGVKGFAF